MANERRDFRQGGGFDTSWIPVFVWLWLFWPVGLFMLINKINKSQKPQQQRRKPLSWSSIGLMVVGAMMLFGRSFSPIGFFAILGGIVAFIYSRMMKGDEKLYIKYANVIGDRPVVPVKAIAAAMPVGYDKAIRDLEKMVNEGYFGPRAYVDHSTGMFVIDSRISRNFINKTAAEYGELVGVPERAAAAPAFSRPQAAAPTSQQAVEIHPQSEVERDFQRRLNEIKALNDKIKDDDISSKILRIEEVTGAIFELVREKPQKRSQIHTFMNYYLPTTVKLLQSYSVLERQNVLGQNIVSTKENIEKMVDQLVFAFEQQLDQMFDAEARDINSDIQVMEKMLQRDGLAENNPYQLPKGAVSPNTNPSPFSTPSDFGTAQAVQQMKEEGR